MPTNIPIDGNRLIIAKALLPDLNVDEKVLIVPLSWRREIHLPQNEFIGAWAVIRDALDRENDEEYQWIEIFERMIEEAEISQVFRDRLILKKEGNIRNSKVNIWRLTVPQELRDIGVFPMPSGGLIAIKEQVGISLWEKASLSFHLSELERKHK